MRVLVAGASGLLGSNLTPHLKSLGHEVVGLSRGGHAGFACDLCDRDFSFKSLDSVAPEAIVNLVALSDVDECETNPNKAFLLNCRTAETLAAWFKTARRKPRVIHISTDHVYDSKGPHPEDDITLTNTYSITKFRSERVMASCEATILRTNFFGMPRFTPPRGFLASLLESMKNDERPEISYDTLFNPLYIPTLVEIMAKLLETGKPGVFNVGSKGGVAKGHFAMRLAEALGYKCAPTHPKKPGSGNAKTPRPGDMRMNCSLFEKTFAIKLPTLDSEIAKAVEELKGSL